ncbi:MAG: nuclear transport factor 2 family protein [Clostridia bacterium]|nr:nuclear transport factor 2 family protein [Clostridia bacterium]
MVCGGYRCTGKDYAEFIKNFDIAAYELSDYEVIYESDEICQIHYVVATEVSDQERNKDLEGKFHVTSTWEQVNGTWKMIFNMDS